MASTEPQSEATHERAAASPVGLFAGEPYFEVTDDGTTYWYDGNDVHHRDGGPAIYDEFYEGWWQHGQLHRDDGPAVIVKGQREEWYVHGKLHRIDGPAVDGKSWSTWAFHGREFDDPADIDLYLLSPVDDRELIAALYAGGALMPDAIAAAARLR